MKTSSSNKLFLSAAALAVGILGATLAQAQPAAGGWTNRYGPGQAIAVAVDASGDVFVTGNSASHYATVAYSSAGVSLWTNGYNGPANYEDDATGLAVDGSGNVVVMGYAFRSG